MLASLQRDSNGVSLPEAVISETLSGNKHYSILSSFLDYFVTAKKSWLAGTSGTPENNLLRTVAGVWPQRELREDGHGSPR